MRDALGWPVAPVVARVHDGGASLAFAAPIDQLLTATEVNEWAWLATVRSVSPQERGSEEAPARDDEAPESPPSFSLTETGAKLPFNDEVLAFVRNLRRGSTDPERLIWSFLRNRRLLGQKFRRQVAIDPYVLDFYCHDIKLAIEIDGGQHGDAAHAAHDARRDAFLIARGIHILRYWNHDVAQRLEQVLASIWSEVEKRLAECHGENEGGGGSPSSALRVPSPKGRREELRYRDKMLPFSLREKVPAGRMREADTHSARGEGEFTMPTFHAPGHPAAWDEDLALHTLRAFARSERDPRQQALAAAARAHDLNVLIDDEEFTIGAGIGAQSWPLADIPEPQDVAWPLRHDIPLALVTGSNGKTTTVRLLAAMLRAHGWNSGFSCTEGLFIGSRAFGSGDFSGPAGARAVLRQAEIEAAVLETARGGILRRGIAVQRADVAVVTNISDDHFGEYGIHSLQDLAEVKLAVARTLGAKGRLVLNADDDVLVQRAGELIVPLAWFALDDDHALLRAHRERAGITCGVRDRRLHLSGPGFVHDLGTIKHMPLSFDGHARYNVANIAAAALAAQALGVDPHTIAAVAARFGSEPSDNPGRLQRWRFGTLDVLVDYAHNPEGLRGLLDLAGVLRGRGRLGLVLGQAGNREDAEVRELARVAAAFHPDQIVLKDIGGMLRGREAGAVPAILRDQLVEAGIPSEAILDCLDESEAVVSLLRWARDHDVLVLPIHGTQAKTEVEALLSRLRAEHWTPGIPFSV